MSEDVQLHAWVEGRVQGVGFRFFVRQQVGEQPITGWVRNLHDGRVEILAEGRRHDLEVLLSAVRQGPTSGLVTDVRERWGTASGRFTQFSIAPTE